MPTASGSKNDGLTLSSCTHSIQNLLVIEVMDVFVEIVVRVLVIVY